MEPQKAGEDFVEKMLAASEEMDKCFRQISEEARALQERYSSLHYLLLASQAEATRGFDFRYSFLERLIERIRRFQEEIATCKNL